MYGRRRYIPELKTSNRNLIGFGERVAMNSPIQGSAADIIKLAMIRVARHLKERGLDAHLILQVHDELLIEAHESCVEEAAAILREDMEQVAALRVPLTVDLNVGDTWYTCK
jgi:DNA polymerase-1